MKIKDLEVGETYSLTRYGAAVVLDASGDYSYSGYSWQRKIVHRPGGRSGLVAVAVRCGPQGWLPALLRPQQFECTVAEKDRRNQEVREQAQARARQERLDKEVRKQQIPQVQEVLVKLGLRERFLSEYSSSVKLSYTEILHIGQALAERAEKEAC